MQNEAMREEIAEQMAGNDAKSAVADLHIRVIGGDVWIDGEGNGLGVLIAVKGVAQTFIKGQMEDGKDLWFSKGALLAALKRAVADATEGDQTKS